MKILGVNFYDDVKDELLKVAVIITKSNFRKTVLCRCEGLWEGIT